MSALACDIAVCGAGPAGLALAASLVDRGVDVVLVDPGFAVWPATYGVWCDEVDARVPLAAVTEAPHVVFRDEAVRLRGRYGVVDNAALHARLCARVPVHRRVAARAVEIGAKHVVTSRGQRIEARLVIDARGAIAGRAARGERTAAQTAVGVVVARDRVEQSALAPYFADGSGVFMDWRPAAQVTRPCGDARGLALAVGAPTFLYAVPVANGRVLLEETALAASPPVPFDALTARLRARLASVDVDVDVAACARGGDVERVFISLDVPLPNATAPYRFGAAGGGVHPATGYSFSSSLRAAERVAAALAASGLGSSAASDAHALAAIAHAACWPASRRFAHRALTHGLDALLALDDDDTAAFFATFFTLEAGDVRSFLAGEDAGQVIRAMARVAGRLPPRLVARVSRAAVFGHRRLGGSQHGRRRQEQDLARG